MRKLLPVFFSVFLVFVALAETSHFHEQACDSPCPAVCLGACGLYCDDAGAGSLADPKDTQIRAVCYNGFVFAAQISEDEIFHPPLT